jgi:hypothetical protein
VTRSPRCLSTRQDGMGGPTLWSISMTVMSRPTIPGTVGDGRLDVYARQTGRLVVRIRPRQRPAASGPRRVSPVRRAYGGPTPGPACRGHLRGVWMQGTRPVMTPRSSLAPTATVRDRPLHGSGWCAVEPMARGDLGVMQGGSSAERARRETRQPSRGPAARPLAAGGCSGPMTEAARAGGMSCSQPAGDPHNGYRRGRCQR